MKKNIGVLMGGYGSEYKISLNSGATVMQYLDRELYEVFELHILKSGWVCLFEGETYAIDPGEFTTLLPFGQVYFDACYNTIHGAPGENGVMQAYLEVMKVPQTSCNFYESALTFNKKDTLSVLKPYGIAMASSVYVNKGVVVDDAFAKACIEKLNLPVFVKPNRAGSSYGVSKVYKVEELAAAIETALAEDDEVLIESFLSGTEVSVGVYDFGKGAQVLPVCEIVPDGDYFSLEAKYSGKSQEIVPARLTTEETEAVQSLTKSVYELLNLKGICRVDFIFHEGTPHFVEVNTNPGLSKESIIPREFKAAGISLTEAFSGAIEACLS